VGPGRARGGGHLRTVGVDLGGTKILAAVVEGGRVTEARKRPTPEGGPEAVAAAIVDLVDDLGGAGRLGVGTPGRVAGTDGVVVGSPNMAGWDRPVPLGELLRVGTGLERVAVGNDVNVATLAEQAAGAGRGRSDLLCVFLGTGVGGGLVLDGRLRAGVHGLTGEIGHTTFRPGGRRCGCGLDGHTEAYAGRVAMEAEARRRHASGEPTALVDLAGDGRMKSGVFAKALAVGDAVATALVDEAVEAVAVAIASAVMLLDLDLVVIGGGVADKLGPAFVGRIADEVRSRLFPGSSLEVVPASLGDHAGVVGAALLAEAG